MGSAETSEVSAPVWRRLAGRAGVEFRRGEILPSLLLFLVFFLLITFQYTTKSVRQSTFINSLGAANLPYVYLLIAISSYPLLRLYAMFADRMRRHTLIAATCIVTSLSMVFFWWLLHFPWPWVAFVFYVWISITVVLLVSQFWSYSNHVFDPRQAKRLFGFIGAGGLLGGIAGGQVARLATQFVGTRYALLLSAVALLGVVTLLAIVHRRAGHGPEHAAETVGPAPLDEARGGFELIRRSRHLQWIATILVLTVVVAQIVDLQFNWAVERATTNLDERTAFFGNFYSLIGILAFVFQLVLTSRIHRLLGVGFAMRVLPVTMALGTFALFGAAGIPEMLLYAALVLKIGENGLRYSLDQATRELLFLPVPSRVRLKAKTFIDVFLQRAAKGLAAILLLPVTFKLVTPVQMGWVSIVLIIVWIAATFAARHQYVESFRAGLKRDRLDPLSIDFSDASTVEVLLQSLGSADPRQVLHGVHLLALHGRGRLVPPLLLYHDDPPVRLATLKVLREAERTDALPLIERRLSDPDPDVRSEAIRTMAALQRQDAPTLMAPYLRSADPSLVSAAAACLTVHGDERMRRLAATAISQMFADASPLARAEAAKAIGEVSDPHYVQELIGLLADRDDNVVRHAIRAVRRRIERDGRNVLYAPAVIALLRNRRVKHDARETLVAFGEPILPALIHFMNEPSEDRWVRRALPKTLASLGTPAAASALIESLLASTDPFLRRKIVEALGSLKSERPAISIPDQKIEEAIRVEGQEYFRSLMALYALGSLQHGRLFGPRMQWDGELHEPSLLEQLLAERLGDSLRNVFGLLAFLYEPNAIWSAHRSLMSERAILRTHAVEYLDNVIAPAFRRVVLPMIDDIPIDGRLAAGKKLFGIQSQSKVELLSSVISTCFDKDDEIAAWTAAALYEVYTGRIEPLYPEVRAMQSRDEAHPFVRETAGWVRARFNPIS